MQIGDKVLYVPSRAHAMDRDPWGNYPWVFGERRLVPTETPGKNREIVEELTPEKLAFKLDFIKRCPDPSAERAKLILLRPAALWPATVMAVNEDSTLNLDIQSPNTGVTIHYSNVPVSEVEKSPHTCHAS